MKAALEAGWCHGGRGLVIKVMFSSVSGVPPLSGPIQEFSHETFACSDRVPVAI